MNGEAEIKTEPTLLTTVEILSGDDVISLLSDKSFLKLWDTLYNSCPWATVFQGKEFVSTWYRIYHKTYLPIVVKAINGGKLKGLLTLARDKSGLITGAGLTQAEYQVWLAEASDSEKFIKSALTEIKKLFRGNNLQFRYIPFETPLDWVKSDSTWKKGCVLQAYQHPLMIINAEYISQELRKMNKKINRLKRLGELKFERITDTQTFSSIFDRLAAQLDFRKGAMYNVTPFQKDPLRKKFLLALFDQSLLHVTILKVNDEIIASNIGTIGKNIVRLQLNTYDPSYAKHSPGMINFFMLGKTLAEEGFDVLDLTPGGSYKERLANNYVLAHELRVAGSIKFYIKEFSREINSRILRNNKKIFSALDKIGISTKALKRGLRNAYIAKERMQKTWKRGPSSIITELVNPFRLIKKKNVYKIEPQPAIDTISIKKNDVGELLRYQTEGSKLTKWEFLANAMDKLEKGQHVFTLALDDSLLSCVWLWNQEDISAILNNRYKLTLPNGSAILHEIYCHPDGKERLNDFLANVANEISRTSNSNHAYVIVDGKEPALCRILENAGLTET